MAKDPIATIREDYGAAYDEVRSIHDSFRFFDRQYEGDGWDDLEKHKNASTPSINLIYANIEQMVSMLSLQHPEVSWNPVASDDVDSAKLLTAYFRPTWKRCKLSHKAELIIRDFLIYGSSFFKPVWEENEEWMDGGDVNAHVISPLNLIPDPLAVDIDSSRFVHLEFVRSKEYVQGLCEQFGVDRKTSEKVLNGAVEHQEMSEATNQTGGLTLIESWYAPSAVFPKGRLVLWTNEGIIRDEDIPYKYNQRIPIVAIHNIKRDGDFWGISEIKNMYNIQQNCNKSLGFMQDMLRYSPRRLVYAGASMKAKTIPNNPNEVIHVGIGETMTTLQQQSIEPAWMNFTAFLKQMLSEVTGIHGVSMGQQGSVTAASAIQSLASLGSTRMETRKRHMVEGMEDLAWQFTRLMKQFYKKDRLVKVAGDEYEPLNAKDISSYYDINAVYSETFPTDPMIRFNMVMQLAQLPPEAQQKAIQIINDPLLNAMYEEQSAALIQTAQQFGNIPDPNNPEAFPGANQEVSV
jgi:hypothetical protein